METESSAVYVLVVVTEISAVAVPNVCVRENVSVDENVRVSEISDVNVEETVCVPLADTENVGVADSVGDALVLDERLILSLMEAARDADNDADMLKETVGDSDAE